MKIFFIVFALLILLYALLTLVFFTVCFVRRKQVPAVKRTFKGTSFAAYAQPIHEGAVWLSRQKYDHMFLHSRDGLRLHAKVLENRHAKRVLVMFHGYRSLPEIDFSCAAKDYWDAGCTLILVDQRAHGESKGRCICFGLKERLDCEDWAHLAAKRYPNLPIYLDGMSMGATTVLMTADAALPENVKGIIADCGYTSPKAIIARTVRQTIHMPAGVWLWGMDLWLKIFTGLKMADFSCAQALENTKLPVIMVHGKADDFVPHEMGVENYNAIPGDKLLLSVENATHGVSFLVEKERIWKELLAFFDRNDTKNTQAKGLRT